MSISSLEIRPFQDSDRPACAEIFTRISDWFGLEESNRAYLAGLSTLPSFVAVRDGAVVAFASLRHHNPGSSELQLLAVDRPLHGQGIGRRVVEFLESLLRERGGIEWFHLKTRGPSEPDENYERTRLFYEALGFASLFETPDLWGPENPALIMVKRLT